MPEFIVPPSVLHQVNEFSTGGFLVMVFDEEGVPQIRVEMDTATHIMAMETFLHRWLSIIDEAQRVAIVAETLYDEEAEADEDEDEDENCP